MLQAFPSGVQGRSPGIFWLFYILNSLKQKEHIVGLVHELIFTLLRVWGSDFGIQNRCTGFKIAMDTALEACF